MCAFLPYLQIVCDIDAFVSNYHGTMGSTFIPKLHMLEDHVVMASWSRNVGGARGGGHPRQVQHTGTDTLKYEQPCRATEVCSI